MIGRLTGQLAEKNPPEILVDCHGVGYEVLVPMSTFYNLPGLGEKVSLHTHFIVREDAQLLYGFGSTAERAAFRLLIKITGIGPRMALSVLSGISVADLAQAVTLQPSAARKRWATLRTSASSSTSSTRMAWATQAKLASAKPQFTSLSRKVSTNLGRMLR